MSNILKLTLICSLIFHVLMGKAAGVGELKQIKENYRQMLIPSSIEQDSLLSDLIKIKPEKEITDVFLDFPNTFSSSPFASEKADVASV